MRDWIAARRGATAGAREHQRKLDLLRVGQPTGDVEYDRAYDALRRAGLGHDPAILVLNSKPDSEG